jgi:hypothetical protein
MNQLTAGLVVLIGILGGFYFGAKYGQGHSGPSTATAAAATSQTGGARTGGTAADGTGATGGGGAGGFTPAAAGSITAVDGTTITVHDRTTNKDVKVDASNARISKTAQGTTADLTQNQTVTVVGQTGSDGTVTAQTIAIGGGGGRRGGAATPTPGS